MIEAKSREYLPSEIAVLVSLVLHTLAILLWSHGEQLGRLTLFKPFAQMLTAPATPPPRPAAEEIVPTITFIEEPRVFIETDATQFTGEEPRDAKFYSTLPTVAANPENPTGTIGDTPYLEGKGTHVASTESVLPSPAIPAMPAPPPAPKPVERPPEEPPKRVADEGLKIAEEKKFVMAEKPPAPVVPAPTPAPGSRREIVAAKSHMTAVGVSRTGVAAFNVAGSPFGEYDKALIRAVQSRWYRLIEANGLYERAGTVTLHFNLLADGSVQNMEVRENSAGQILGLFCEKAVVDSSPFAPLPENLLTLIGYDPREVNFTFYY